MPSTFKIFLYLLCFFVMAFTCTSADPIQIKLAWEKSEETIALQYNVYMRLENQSYNDSEPVWTGDETNCTIDGMDEDGVYFFIVKAVNEIGETSEASNQVCWYKPILTLPENEAINTTVNPLLTTIIPLDPEYELFHAATQWQINKGSDFTIESQILDFKTEEHLTTLSVDQFDLNYGTKYFWRVKHFDSLYTQSLWSETFIFTTIANNGADDSNPNPDPDLDPDSGPDVDPASDPDSDPDLDLDPASETRDNGNGAGCFINTITTKPF